MGLFAMKQQMQIFLGGFNKKDERIHGTTHEVVSLRAERERAYLNVLPHQAFDTSYRIHRKVYKDCTVRFEGNSYVVPHTLVSCHA